VAKEERQDCKIATGSVYLLMMAAFGKMNGLRKYGGTCLTRGSFDGMYSSLLIIVGPAG